MRRFWLLFTAALALPAAAQAHVEPKPPFVTVSANADVTLDVPNERQGAAMTTLVVEVPADVRVVDAAAPPGWEPTVAARRIVFTGGALPPGATLPFEATLRARTVGTTTLRAVQRFDDGDTVPWDVELSVLPPSAPPKQHPERALVAAMVGVGAVALGLLLVHRLRRRSLQET